MNSSCLSLLSASTRGNIRSFSTTTFRCLIQKWRQDRGLPLNPNACGDLTDGPDYSFLDGRPTPYGVRQRQRILKQREIADRIIRLSQEVDFAVERHKQIKIDEDNHRKQLIATRFKPKGAALLKQPSKK